MDTNQYAQPYVDEKLFRLLVASVKDYAIFLIDINGYILSWNEGAANIKGYTTNEVVGKHVSIFYQPNDSQKQQLRHNLNHALKNGMQETEGLMVRKDGSVFWAHVVFTTLYNDNGHLIGFANITRDITERKKAEDEKAAINTELEKRVKENTEKIITNELRFRKLIENSHDGITLLDENLHVTYRSNASERINGWTNEERQQYEVYDLIHPGDAQLVSEQFKQILARPGQSMSATYRIKHKLGHYIWVECFYTNMLNDESIGAIVCNFRDITERKQADEEISKKTEQIANIFESITDGFIALNENLCYTYANKRIGEMLGFEPQELIGKCVWEVFPDAIGSETYQAINIALKEQRYVWNEDFFEPLHLWQENHIYPSGTGLSIFIRDITERKYAELEITELNDSLEKKVVERTVQLDAANKELESFSYSVSHDLRTPLRAVNGYAMMLKEDYETQLGEEGGRIINTIMHNARHMGQLIDDLLAFSRLGRKAVVVNDINTTEMVKACTAELLAHEKQPFNINIPPLPHCQADSSMLKQVWMNLIGNAIKYSAKNGGPHIEIGAIENIGETVFYVQDNGVGFDMKYSDKLFGVFQRLHRQDEFEGTGVGLALVKRIVEKHGGRIWAKAAPGAGATFSFSLPQGVPVI